MTTAPSATIIAFCWLIFLAYWFITASAVKVTLERKSPQSSLSYRIPAVLGMIFLWFRRSPHPLNLALTPQTDLMQAAAAILCVCGLLVAVWSRRTLAGNWSATVTFKQGHELIKSGPYRFTRHPIYTGILLMCLGQALEIGRLRSWLGLLLVAISFWIKLRQEETLMLQHFPDQYPAYRKQVKALIPFIL